MQIVLNKKVFSLLTVFLILLNCVSCKGEERYYVKNYLLDLAYATGISIDGDIDQSFEDLKKWNVVRDEERTLLENVLTFDYLSKTIERILSENDGMKYLKQERIISEDEKKSDKVNKVTADKTIQNITNKLNNRKFDNQAEIILNDAHHLEDYYLSDNKLYTDETLSVGELVYLNKDGEYKKVVGYSDNYYVLLDPNFDEIYDTFNIQGSEEINFEDAQIIPYTDEIDISKSTYSNLNYELLSIKKNKFSKDGFDISYSFNSSGIDVHIAKSKNNGPTLFFDINLNSVKPTYKWEYNEGKIKNAFFKINFNLTNEVGVSTGKYNNYYLDLKNKDSPSFLGFVKSSLRTLTKDDEIEATIPICKIKTPIPNVPFAYFNIDVLAKFYVSGKVEVVLYNKGAVGFEIIDSKFRVVHDIDHDVDSIIGASARAVAGLNFNIESSKVRLMDVELDGGVRAAVSTTIHMYDGEGNKSEEEVDVPYAVVELVAKENDNIKVCGDVSLNWVLDLQFNTSKTIPYKYGFTYKKSFLGTSNQIFKNKTHIENWQFVKSCTRKSKTKTNINEITKANSNKITLKKYSAVVIKGETYEIPIVSLPSSYTESDLVFTPDKENIVTCKGKYVVALNIGSTSIEIKTKDDKYKASINILVSTG